MGTGNDQLGEDKHDGVTEEVRSLGVRSESSSPGSSPAPPARAPAPAPAPQKKPSLWKRFNKHAGLDLETFKMMFKGGIPFTVALAMYQSEDVAKVYGILGFIIPVSVCLGAPLLPRAKFLQNIAFCIIGTGCGAVLALLMYYTSFLARKHTTPPGQPLTGYNSSASAVAALWLFAQVYFINVLKSARPQFLPATVLYATLCIIGVNNTWNTYSMHTAFMQVYGLTKSFNTGFALCVGVSLFIFPRNCRTYMFHGLNFHLMKFSQILDAQTDYMSALETNDIFDVLQRDTSAHQPGFVEAYVHMPFRHRKALQEPLLLQKARKLHNAATELSNLHARTSGDVLFVKREIAWGKLDGHEIEHIHNLVGTVVTRILGSASIIEIIERVCQAYGLESLKDNEDPSVVEATREAAAKEWQEIMRTLHEPFASMTEVLKEGFEHVKIVLELHKPAKNAAVDPEAEAGAARAGTPEFAAYLVRKTHEFYKSREVSLSEWCRARGLDNPDALNKDKMREQFEEWVRRGVLGLTESERLRRQLFMMLYMEYNMWAVARSVLALIRYVDKKRVDGTLSRSRFIHPSLKSIGKWMSNAIGIDDRETLGTDDGIFYENDQEIHFGAAFKSRRDPEHLPPVNWFERVGTHFRRLPAFFRSEHSVFGLRGAAAAMTLAILLFLHDTQSFFVRQRLLWSVTLTCFAMSRTSGQSLWNAMTRIIATFSGMITVYIAWYMVNGVPAGVIVFCGLFVSASQWLVLKKPRYFIVTVIYGVTVAITVAYEFQVQMLGVAVSERNGQPVYPIYKLAPYRFAAVTAGVTVAYIWSVFPYPISETSELRRSVGGALYLVANHYSIAHEIVRMRVTAREGDLNAHHSPTHMLDKERATVFTKTAGLLSKLEMANSLTKWHPQVGGAFPRDSYARIILLCRRVLNYSSLIIHASGAFSLHNQLLDESGDSPEEAEMREYVANSQWRRDYRSLVLSAGPTSHDITTMLSMLSSAVTDGKPLPPYLKPPADFQLLKRLESMDTDILSVKHIKEPGYSAFAVMQVASRVVVADVTKLQEEIKALVGEMDFSFHVVSTSAGRGDENVPVSHVSTNDSLATPFSDDSKEGKLD